MALLQERLHMELVSLFGIKLINMQKIEMTKKYCKVENWRSNKVGECSNFSIWQVLNVRLTRL